MQKAFFDRLAMYGRIETQNYVYIYNEYTDGARVLRHRIETPGEMEAASIDYERQTVGRFRKV